MTNTQRYITCGVDLRSHEGVTLQSGKHIQYVSPLMRRQVTPSPERKHEEHLSIMLHTTESLKKKTIHSRLIRILLYHFHVFCPFYIKNIYS